MQVREAGDPRLEAMFGLAEARELGVRPVVRLPRSGPPTWLIAAGALVAAIFLFWMLESRRLAPAEPSTRARAADASAFAVEPPPLYVPPAPAPVVVVQPAPQPMPTAQAQPRVYAPPVPQIAYYPQPAPAPEPQPMPPPPRSTSGPVLVIDSTAPAAVPTASAADGSPAQSLLVLPLPRGAGPVGRARASALANRSTTVAQGTLIPAVLETAFDSTRPGFARAIVSRDVRGFDGTKVLIPRGSRLVGEYRSEVFPSQKRALINWTRLVRPDGATIALDSPAVDQLGRGGVRANVDTHFWARFGDALLQSTVEIGRALAMNSASTSVIVAVPNGAATGAAAPAAQSGARTPTLTVPAATSVSIFVARDLDFGSREDGQ